MGEKGQTIPAGVGQAAGSALSGLAPASQAVMKSAASSGTPPTEGDLSMSSGSAAGGISSIGHPGGIPTSTPDPGTAHTAGVGGEKGQTVAAPQPAGTAGSKLGSASSAAEDNSVLSGGPLKK
jgi:hypothetical protein